MKYILLFIIVNIVILYILMLTVPSWCVYTSTMKRKNKNKWSRDNIQDMHPIIYKEGNEWFEAHRHLTKEVHIVNQGLNLYGEYYDLGFDRCVVILSGRTDTLRYGYYFAKPYEEAGYNILVIDPRAHGKSDGIYNTAGFEESKDALAWCRYIHDEFDVKSILLHGICIGGAGAMLAATSKDCPEYIEGIVADGIFSCFNEIMKKHLIERKKPTGILLKCIDIWMKLYTGHTMTYGPINVIGDYHRPLLLLHGKEDIFSSPENAQLLYDMCPSENKALVWFEKGEHSLLRTTNRKKYDESIKEFINKNLNKERYLKCIVNIAEPN